VDIGIPLRELGAVDIAALSERILGLDADAWMMDQRRQQDYDVHKRTESVVLVFTDGAGWPDITVSREAGWDLLADVAVPLMQDIIARHYPPGGTIIRAMAAKLLPGEVITPHRDSHPSFAYGHRIHVPITTNPRVRFMIAGRPYQFKVGQAYEINNLLPHSVMNKGSDGRITFIFDYVPAEKIDRGAG
jgi:hypothetical protein